MEARDRPVNVAYSDPVDAIVLAGTDHNPKRMIRGQNKAFLEIGGQVLVHRVVEALLFAENVGHVFVVGPLERLEDSMGGMSPRVTLVDQVGKMLPNAWQAIHAAEAHERGLKGVNDPQRPLLFLSSDLPLISPQAVDDFVRRCARLDDDASSGHALLCGVADETSLQDYYSENGQSGINRPYVNFAEARVRLANIYVGRPRVLENQAFLQTGFEHRKAEKWKNVLGLTWSFLSQPGGLQAAWLSLRMQATLMASRRQGWIYRRLRSGNSSRRTELVCSKVLGGAVRMVITPYGGLSLDADNESDFDVLSERYDEWREIPPAKGIPTLP